MICGFQWHDHPWIDGHLHECIAEDEHDDDNPRHFCECGDRQDCTHGEISYSAVKAITVEIVGDDTECPF